MTLIPTNEPGDYAYDVWLRQQWYGEPRLTALNASMESEEEEEHEEHVDVDYPGLLAKIKALSASMGISTSDEKEERPPTKNVAALLNMGEKMLFGRRT